jgi:protein pelota
MHIVKKDFRKGIVKIRIDDPDDFWYLNTIIETGDLVKGKTTRKIRIGDGDNAKVAKKTLTLQIEAETVEYTSTSLRVNGKIKDGPEDIPRDSYHAISLEIKEEYTIHKKNWFSYHKQKLEEATSKKYNYLLCLLDREEAIFAITKKYGYKVLTKLKGTVPKKSREIAGTKDFQKEIISQIEEYNNRFTPDAIIIASPAFYKDEISKRITNKEIKKKIVLAISSSVTESALDEVIKRPELASILKDSRARQEQMLVEELLSAIKKGNLATYGFEHVTEAVKAGAVSTLLFTDKFIQKRKESDEFVDVEELLKKIDSLQGNIHIISSEHEGGKKLDGLGGIAALLRFKIH